MIGNEGTPVVCIASPRPRETAETFIRAHMDRLAARVRVLSGVPPLEDDRDGCVLTPSLPVRVWRKMITPFATRTKEGPRDRLVARYLRRANVQCVLAEYGKIAAFMVGPCRLAGVPLIAHFHGHDAYSEPLINRHRAGYDRVFQTAAAVVGVSRDMVRRLVEIGAPADRVHYIPYSVDVNRFRGASPTEAPPHFVGVGRFVETKAPYLTLLAFAKLREVRSDVRLTIAGEGPLRGPCLDLADHLGVADAIDFPGNVPHARVAELFRTARAFVQHSIRCRDGTCEGTPNAVLEAQAAGLPVVSTRHAGISDVVVEGGTGLLVEERDVEGMARALGTLADQPEVAGRMGQAGREHILANFSEQQTIARLDSLIQRVSQPRTEPGTAVPARLTPAEGAV